MLYDHRYRVTRDTDKASIFFYTIIDLIALGAHDGGTGGPDEGRQPASRLQIPGLAPPLLGILAFALPRESYTWFYGRYGVIPEDVGVSQIRMLTGVLRMFHLWSMKIPGRPASSFLIVLIGIWTYFAVGRRLLRLRAGDP